MADKYITHNIFLESAAFNILVIEFPDEDANDRLSILAIEKGLIYKKLYEDFVLGTCLSNSGPFFYHISQRQELMQKFMEIREEALRVVYEYSPAFKPDNIFINNNNVLKTAPTVKDDKTARPLVENELWLKDPPLNYFESPTLELPPADLDDDNPFVDLEEDQTELFDSSGPFGPPNTPSGPEVPYELIGHRWDKLGLPINVKKYEEEEDTVVSLLGKTSFDTKQGYLLLIVQLCIEDFSDVFHLLDSLGVSKNIAPAKLISELYNIAVEYNPFLKLENVDLKTIRKDRQPELNTQKFRNRKTAAAARTAAAPRRKKKFTDVPKENLLALPDNIKTKIVGQDKAVEALSAAVSRAAVGLKREHEPVGVFLFTGNSGVGKTETSKALAQTLDANLVRIDCSEYQHSHEVTKLTGAPPGYVGHEEGGQLTSDVAKYPFSIVLFDEIEKAHSNFHERILQIIDDGILTDGRGRRVQFKDTIIIMTSNIGVKEVEAISRTVGFGDVSSKTKNKTEKAREVALKNKFKPEFLNRVDDIIHFRTLDNNDYLKILDILLEETRSQIKKSKDVVLSFNIGAKNFLLDKGVDKDFGARPMRRAVKTYVNTPLATAILKEEVGEGSRVSVGLAKSKDHLLFRQVSKTTKKETKVSGV